MLVNRFYNVSRFLTQVFDAQLRLLLEKMDFYQNSNVLRMKMISD